MTAPNVKRWRDDREHLPSFLRDFHDQKDVFKALHQHYRADDRLDTSWIDGHIYTIDFFLWFMAEHGYTLQKSEEGLDFTDLDDTLGAMREREAQALRAAMEGR